MIILEVDRCSVTLMWIMIFKYSVIICYWYQFNRRYTHLFSYLPRVEWYHDATMTYVTKNIIYKF